ncbi:MtrAB system accessory lipoprotein LpqB [Nocardia transvalensis]|uniref:MtrAB system accessory lipoprotein LpqB n=1 Tax=Nocardia transvalensis TaxID=37333 RepID=UPI00189454EB|nr:MtrAB system accessory lipoprotein LpqB [Nocardia transvalensis]MBF6327165.1 MtrAB system accessory protein LpqB [Nocardia transvalensis]
MSVFGRKTGLRVAIFAVLTGLLALTGCADLPDSSAPQALGTINREPASTAPPEPRQGRDPDLLLRDFFEATADATNHHQAARQYLTPSEAATWDDAANAAVIESPDTLRESRSGDTATYKVRANRVGEIRTDGSFVASAGAYEVKIEMTRVGSEWRISQLQPGVAIVKTSFEKYYRRSVLYYPNSAGTAMVPDLRWVSQRKDQLAQQLMNMLAAGPQPELRPAVRNMLSGPVAMHGPVTKANGQTDGVGVGAGGVQIDFSGASALDQHSKELLAAQVVLTLSGSEVLGPYVLLADGKPLDERYAATGWSVADVNAMNPTANSRNRIGLHAVQNGTLVEVDTTKNEIVPTKGYFGTVHNLQSVALPPDGQLVAAVADSGQSAPQPPRTLVIGTYDGADAISVEQGNTFTRPSWAADGSAAWTVVDGERVIRVVHDRTTGNVSKQEVDTSELFAPPADPTETPPRLPITDLRIDRSGARAVLIAGGKVYAAVVSPRPGGKYALTSPLPVAVDLSTPVVSVDWYSADTVMFAREGLVEPVQTVRIDGSDRNPMTSQNLSPPVRVVSATPDVQYVADSRAVLQLQSAEPTSERFWREVYNLGPNAVPVLPG